jgi:hypothetical protein
LLGATADAPSCSALDPGELLDVDVDKLAGPRPLVADRLLEAEPAEFAHPDPGQDPGDRRERHPERLSDLGRGETQPPQLRDRLDTIRRPAVRDTLRSRRPINEAGFAGRRVSTDPLARTANADTRTRRRGGDRPTIIDNQLAQPTPASPAESGVSVKIHPVTSLGPSCL